MGKYRYGTNPKKNRPAQFLSFATVSTWIPSR